MQVVRGQAPRAAPDELNGVEFGTVCWQEEELDLVRILAHPVFDGMRVVIADVVQHHEELVSPVVANELLKKRQERCGIESLRESEVPARIVVDADRAKDLCRLAAGFAEDLNPYSLGSPRARRGS